MTSASPEPTELEPTSCGTLGSRLFNVFSAPGELFEALRDVPPAHSNWVVPLLVSMASGILFSIVVFSQPDIVAGIAVEQEAALAARVEAGQMTQEQADQAMVGMNRFIAPGMLMLFGSVGSVLGGALFFVIVALLLWLLTARILRGEISLLRAFELAGLAGMIFAVGGLLTMTLVLLRGDLQAGLNLAWFLERFDATRFTHQLLAAVDAVTIWYLVVLSIGAGKLARRSSMIAAAWIFGFWVLARGGLALGSAWWAQVQAGM
jgi:hypothetical protein